MLKRVVVDSLKMKLLSDKIKCVRKVNILLIWLGERVEIRGWFMFKI